MLIQYAVKEFLTEKILRGNDNMTFKIEEKESIFSIDIVDKSEVKIHLTFVFWFSEPRVTILIDDCEIVDEDFEMADDLLSLIKILISNTVIKTEKVRGAKTVCRKYEYSLPINGKEERLKDERKYAFNLGSFEEKTKVFEAWF